MWLTAEQMCSDALSLILSISLTPIRAIIPQINAHRPTSELDFRCFIVFWWFSFGSISVCHSRVIFFFLSPSLVLCLSSLVFFFFSFYLFFSSFDLKRSSFAATSPLGNKLSPKFGFVDIAASGKSLLYRIHTQMHAYLWICSVLSLLIHIKFSKFYLNSLFSFILNSQHICIVLQRRIWTIKLDLFFSFFVCVCVFFCTIPFYVDC